MRRTDIEDLLAKRGVMLSYEPIRLWCQKFGSVYARRLRKRAGCLGDKSLPVSRRTISLRSIQATLAGSEALRARARADHVGTAPVHDS